MIHIQDKETTATLHLPNNGGGDTDYISTAKWQGDKSIIQYRLDSLAESANKLQKGETANIVLDEIKNNLIELNKRL